MYDSTDDKLTIEFSVLVVHAYRLGKYFNEYTSPASVTARGEYLRSLCDKFEEYLKNCRRNSTFI